MSLDKLKEVSILDVANRLGLEIRKKNSICFMHDEKTPSLTFDDKKGVFFCHGCSKGGDIIDLVKERTGKDFNEAKEWLYENFLGGKPTSDRYSAPKPKVEPISVDCQPDIEVYNWIVNQTPLSSSGRNYLNSRGFNDDTIDHLKIRDITNTHDFFIELFNQWGKERLLNCGLLKVSDGVIKPIWWDYVILFPFLDRNDNTEYLQARRLISDKPKYLNLSGLSRPIYNIRCIEGMGMGENLLICEGITDAITLIQRGHNCIALLGASSKLSQHISSLVNYNIIVVPDGDTAGEGMFQSVRLEFKKVGRPVQKCILPKDVKDVNELFGSNN